MGAVSKLLQVDREVSKVRRATLKARSQPAPAPAEPEAVATLQPTDPLPPAEPASPVTPAPQSSGLPPQPTPEPPAATLSRPDAAAPSRRIRWTNWLAALAMVAGVSVAAFDVWRRFQPAIRQAPQPATAQPSQEPAPVYGPSLPAADQPPSEVQNTGGGTTGTARQATADVLTSMERAVRNAVRAIKRAQAQADARP